MNGDALLDRGPAWLELFDLSGRRVWRRAIDEAAGLRQTVVLGEGRALPAGIYLVRLSQSGRTASARVAMLR